MMAQAKPWCLRAAAIAGLTLCGTPAAQADRYEATFTLRPTGGLARITEDVGGRAGGSPMVASVYGGGLDVGLSYGARNWLDVGAELCAAGFTEATYDQATVTISRQPATGQLERTTRTAQLRFGATFRGGVAWVPVLYLGLGAGARHQTDAQLVRAMDGFVLMPDMQGGVSFDVIGTARVGIEHRLDRRWTVGLGASVTHAIGIDRPSIDTVVAGISLAASWYPRI